MIATPEKNTDLAESTSVLVVDDEPEVMAVIREMLEGESYKLISAYSVAEAKSILRRENIHIILSDLLLGDGTGGEVLEEARKNHPESQIILITGKPTIENAIKMLKKGACDYLTKPFGLETLKMTLHRAKEKILLKRENIQLRELMSFYRISEAMGTTMEINELLTLILDTAVKEFEADVASLYFIEKDEKRIELKATVGTEDKSILKMVSEHCLSVSEEAIRTSIPAIYNDPDPDYSSKDISIKSSLCQRLMAKGKILGTLVVVRIKNSHPFSQGQLIGLELLASKAAGAIENTNLYQDLKETYIATVETLANAIEARDTYTRGHTERVYLMSRILADELDWTEEQLGDLRIGGILHDIGKIGVPDAILNKPGTLTPEEFDIMRKHPENGARMVESISFLKPALPYIKYHHERHDGRGYPYGLKGNQVPYPGRLLAVVDTIDAITSDRAYRKGRSMEDAIEEIKANSGTQFHPEVVDACLRAYSKGKLNFAYGKNQREEIGNNRENAIHNIGK